MVGLARKAISYYLESGEPLEVDPSEVPDKRLMEDGACFVTLRSKRGGALRGCIGSLEAERPLIFDLVANALGAAFEDPRFAPLAKPELPKISIEVSVLTKPRPLLVSSSEDLLMKLAPSRHGLIIRKGMRSATFLPSVWEELPDPAEFLSSLCMKAGLRPDEWKDVSSMEFLVYETESFSEGSEGR